MSILATRWLGPEDLSEYLCQKAGWAIVSIPAVGVREKQWIFPPFDDHTHRCGEPLTGRMEWDDLEIRLQELGGDAFAYQYLQGEYVPEFMIRGNMVVTEEGRVVSFQRPSESDVDCGGLPR